MKLKDRVHRHLDLAAARGAFEASGSLIGLSAEEIADGIAAEWDGRNRGRLIMIPGDSAHEAAALERHVASWFTSRDGRRC